MKKAGILLGVSAIALSSCATQGTASNTESNTSSTTSETMSLKDKYNLKTDNSLLCDTNFKSGLSLFSPETTTAHLEKKLDYNGETAPYYGNEAGIETYWKMAQWWTPYNFTNATYSKNGDTHHYENESRVLEVNPKTGFVKMQLDAAMEYEKRFGGPKPGGEPWSHFLLSQAIPAELEFYPARYDNLHVKFDVTIDECTYKGDNEKPIGQECAQLFFYLHFINDVPDESQRKTMWFGVPIFDSRYDHVEQYIAMDEGFEGATNSLIYSIASDSYMGQKFEMNKKYQVDIDILEYLKQAFIYAVKNNAMPADGNWNNFLCFDMNFGWEIPGEFKISSTFENMDVYVAK